MKIAILVTGRQEEIIETLLRIIHKNMHWSAKAAFTDETAIKLFDTSPFHIVLLSSGIEEKSERNIIAYFKRVNPAVIIIQHYGGGSGLLSNEILEALQEKNLHAIN